MCLYGGGKDLGREALWSESIILSQYIGDKLNEWEINILI
jgi:hypothetical protein